MDRRTFLKSAFIFTAGSWVAKNGILRPAEARMNLAVVGGGVAASGPNCSGLILCQNLETATTGYDNGETWVNEAGGITPNFATASVTGAPANWLTQCLKIVNDGGGDKIDQVHTDLTGGPLAITYTRLEIIFGAIDTTTAPYATSICELWANDGSHAVYCWNLCVQRVVTTFYFYVYANLGGAGIAEYQSDAAIVVNTPYRVEFKYDCTGHEFSWKVGADVQDTATITAAHPNGAFCLHPGANDTQARTYTIYFDRFAVKTTDWVGTQ